jgi:hypothetical protein
MDEHLILEFPTKTSAEQGLFIINQIAIAYWQSQGYTVIDGQLVPKNNDGTDNLEAQRTTTWDVVKQSPDKTWYFTSPSSDERFKAWRDRLPESIVLPPDKVFPESWNPIGD